jgi:hypothetical protein
MRSPLLAARSFTHSRPGRPSVGKSVSLTAGIGDDSLTLDTDDIVVSDNSLPNVLKDHRLGP